MTAKKEKQQELGSRLSTTPIAIVGMASLFPGADDLSGYWDNILNKINSITEVPENRWKIEDYYDADPKKEDKVYCKMGGFINDVPFNPMEYGLPPNLLEVTDVSQLISLVVAKEALQDAGYLEMEAERRERTGVILGVVGMSLKLFTPLMSRLQYPIWEKALRSSGIPEEDIQTIVEKIKLAYVGWTENSFPGTIGNVISGRVANRFDLGGTNCVIDAACASSLAAIRMAIMELTDHRADMMVTGGLDTDNSIASYICFSKTPAFSKSDRVRTFDEESDGMMVGEGLGMLVLKRLEDAERDGDRIYAVIKGVGSSSDGRYKSIYAPRSDGQAIALRRAYEEAGFAPDTVGLIEAHGTGTMAGDPAEVEGMKLVFKGEQPKKQHIALGSVKSNIGHTKAAAGTAGLIKASLALYHKVLPPTINVSKPNSKFNLTETELYINTEARPWIRTQKGISRRAGVSAFGFGGTNFHVVLEEYEAEHARPYRLNQTSNIILLAAETAEQLKSVCQHTQQALNGAQGEFEFHRLIQSSKSLNPPMSHARLGFVARTRGEAVEFLKQAQEQLTLQADKTSWSTPKGLFYRQTAKENSAKIVSMFSGQGSQYVNMGLELALNFPTVREQFGKVDQLFVDAGQEALSEIVFPIPAFDEELKKQQETDLRNTRHAQPAIGTLSMALYKTLQQAGFSADMSVGHSFGELTALWAAGVLSDEDFLKAAKARGDAMAAPTDANFDAGSMLAVKGDIAALEADLKAYPQVTIANYNSPQQVVLAGPTAEIQKAQAGLAEKGYSVVSLPVSAAFHTSLVAHAQKPFAAALKGLTFNAPRIPVYSNTTAQAHAVDGNAIRTLLEGHVLNAVQFTREIEQVYADGGRVFVEFGPKAVLANLVRDILKTQSTEIEVLALNPNAKADSDVQFRQAVMQLKVLGVVLGDVDPFAKVREPKETVEAVKGTLNLSAGLYRSEKSIQAFEEAVSKVVPLSSMTGVPALREPQSMTSSTGVYVAQNNSNSTAEYAEPLLMELDSVVEQFQQHQTQALKLHDQYLQNDASYTEIVGSLTSQQLQLAQEPVDSLEKNEQLSMVLKSVNRSMDRIHHHQNETARLHEQYIENHADFTRSFTQLLRTSTSSGVVGERVVSRPTSNGNGNGNGNGSGNGNGNGNHPPVASAPIQQKPSTTVPAQSLPLVDLVASNPTADFDANSVFESLLSIVAEKTGYPREMIEPQMDMEADLGIDSIKRVEILGALQEANPGLPEIPAETLAETHTLQQIADLFPAVMAATSKPMPSVATVVQPAPLTQAQTVDFSSYQTSLLQIIAEKTGYPVEMLEPSMDMESDLGIDSIKKVEILGALQEAIPSMPEIPAETLAELRTMQDILSLFQTTAGTSTAVQAEVTAAPVQVPPVLVIASSLQAVDTEAIMPSLLAIVAEKTGYPLEMLEVDMDLEADLGIDSIKRVEILGALQEAHPNLPELQADELSELNTLKKIQEVLEKKARAGSKPGSLTQAAVVEKTQSLPVFSVRLEEVPQPDQLQLQFPSNGLYLVLEDGRGLAEPFAKQLEVEGWKTALVRLTGLGKAASKAKGSKFMREILLQDAAEESILALIQNIRQKGELICGLTIFAAPQKAQSAHAFIEERSQILNQVAFLFAKQLQADLVQVVDGYRKSFVVVTRNDGHLGMVDPLNSDPLSGGLYGLIKTLSLEWPGVFCRAIDFSKDVPLESMLKSIQAEILDPNLTFREVAYTGTQRQALLAEDKPQGDL